jgi:hypothetical protein
VATRLATHLGIVGRLHSDQVKLVGRDEQAFQIRGPLIATETSFRINRLGHPTTWRSLPNWAGKKQKSIDFPFDQAV